MRVAQLVDDLEYVNTNCWQHQLVEALQEHCQLDLFVLGKHRFDPQSYNVILSTLKLRTLDTRRSNIKELIGDRQLLVYDQDPWESFIDTAHYRGAYERIAQTLNVASFLTTSQHWVDRIVKTGLPSDLIRMWMLPRYCDEGTTWSDRPIKVGFKGTLHPYRRRYFEQLKQLGVDVTVLPSGRYNEWLKDLSTMQFFIHFEDDNPWSIDGKQIVKNCCWAKEIEVASRGCFTIREAEPESTAYFIGQIPSVLTYSDLSEVPALIAGTLNDSSSNEKSRAGVEFVRARPAWQDLFSMLTKHSRNAE